MPVDPAPRLWVPAAVAVLLSMGLGCSRTSFTFETYQNGEWRNAPWELTQARIQRDGSKVVAHFVIEGPTDERLLLESHVALNPQVSYLSGTWTHIRGSAIAGAGVLRSDSFDFMGGQGGQPSIGGRFELRENDGTMRYRARIPATQANVVTWP